MRGRESIEGIRAILARSRLGLIIVIAFAVGGGSGACSCEPDEIIQMTCANSYIVSAPPATCRDLCETVAAECVRSDECPANAWGTDSVQCDMNAANIEGISLDVGCDDPLPYLEIDPQGFEAFACCCEGGF